jgi:hypothetical protein
MSSKDRDQEHNREETPENSEPSESETILMALDQISQTIDVMTSVVGRLRHFVENQEPSQEAEIREAMRTRRTLH